MVPGRMANWILARPMWKCDRTLFWDPCSFLVFQYDAEEATWDWAWGSQGLQEPCFPLNSALEGLPRPLWISQHGYWETWLIFPMDCTHAYSIWVNQILLRQFTMLSETFTFLILTKHTELDRGRGDCKRVQKESLFPKGQPTEKKLFLPPPPTRSGLTVYFYKEAEVKETSVFWNQRRFQGRLVRRRGGRMPAIRVMS